jgi:hypothetical protein
MGAYGDAALAYYEATDIGSPIPLWYPGGTKAPAAKECTGYFGRYPEKFELATWVKKYAHSDIGLRLRPDVIGIDVDLYEGKAGSFTIALLQKKWGKLPPTWTVTSRTDGSGIYLYTAPPDLTERMRDPRGYVGEEQVLGGVEVIRWCHRFITVPPSRHPREGRPPYEFFGPERVLEPASVPSRADLAPLPEGWVTGLCIGGEYNRARVAVPEGPVKWLASRPNGEGEPCYAMRRDLTRYVREVRQGSVTGNCYDAVRQGVFALVGNAAEGCSGAATAVRSLGTAYIRAMRQNGRRTDEQVRKEFLRCLTDAVSKRAAGKLRSVDPCSGKV